MRHCLMLGALACALLCGCTGAKTPVAPQVAHVTYGDYDLEYETIGNYSSLASSPDDGQGNEVFEFTLTTDDGQRQLRIHKGVIALNGVALGDHHKGDRLKLAADGKLFVNGTERHPDK